MSVVEYLLFPECYAHCRQMVGYTLLMCFQRLEASCRIGMFVIFYHCKLLSFRATGQQSPETPVSGFRTSYFTIHVLEMLFTGCGANPLTENRWVQHQAQDLLSSSHLSMTPSYTPFLAEYFFGSLSSQRICPSTIIS